MGSRSCVAPRLGWARPLKNGTSPAQQPGRTWLHFGGEECAIVIFFLSSPISLSKAGTKSGQENMLFHWVKIYYQGNYFCHVQKRKRGALERCPFPRAFGQLLLVSSSENVPRWPVVTVLTQDQRHRAQVTEPGSRSWRLPVHAAGTHKCRKRAELEIV